MLTCLVLTRHLLASADLSGADTAFVLANAGLSGADTASSWCL